ncbi:tripartite tricarboxylate transporter substrate binding protein [Roseomonas stagni]|uniref:Tripartite tricarboxylate transporter substrate binding protein n=1 Tax=Falsiroseomonas algicola TaxID=2716930 RepID=A0A6M1LUS8_9PROT|nr:tripartite tricarboxylate transporter substrate-binding protein [Falsiroseomonas algicola]NGM23762.1 tripartite tricarboxylate transporter substrate binding protein [Falsiroseomonas algicola]
MVQRRSLIALSAMGIATPAVLRAQGSWPDRPIRLIVPWAPGGSTDTIARLFQPRLAQVLGQPVVIENRGGASGAIGAAEAARAPADGSTWMFQYDNEGPNQTLMRLTYRTLEAFAPVSLVATGPLAMVCHSSTPFRTFRDVVDAAKREPDRYNYATSGAGGLAHIATTLLQQQNGFKLTHVPYRGGGPAVTAAVANEVPLFMTNVVIVSQHIRNGTLRPLGVTTRTESRHVPGTPSFAQQGFGDFEAPTWWAMFGRAGTPQPIMDRMHAALTQVLREPEVKARIEEQGCDIQATDGETCRRFVANEIERWGQVIRDNGIRADS